MLTHTCWVMVMVQLLPEASLLQTTRGEPWQVTDTVPTVVAGVTVSGAVISRHWVTTLLHPSSGPGGLRLTRRRHILIDSQGKSLTS